MPRDGEDEAAASPPGSTIPPADEAAAAPAPAPADEAEEESAAEPALYGTIPRRIQAVLLDGTFLLILLVLVTSLSARLPPGAGRWTNRALIAAVLLYEPLLVSLRGGTLGHRLLNLQVVADDGGRISFFRAVLRSLTKALLGWFSFVFMSITRRHQALHDLAARATVQLRDPSRADESHYVAERHEPEAVRRVHFARRLLVAVGYAILAAVLVGALGTMAVTAECLDQRVCSPAESALLRLTDIVLTLALIAILVLGWQGKLPGARSRGADSPESDPAPTS